MEKGKGKCKTVLVVRCINGHDNELDVQAFGVAWGFKCFTCGTLYCAYHVSRVEEVPA
jgi:hypothetical protein